jgi:hypothetical protein
MKKEMVRVFFFEKGASPASASIDAYSHILLKFIKSSSYNHESESVETKINHRNKNSIKHLSI